MPHEIVQANPTNLSPSHCANLRKNFSRTDAAKLLAVMTSVYSERKGANLELLVDQWHDALQYFELWVIEAAWRRCRSEEKFFPSIATFLGYVKAERQPNAPTAASLYSTVEPEVPFCREGRTEAEEVAHRVSLCLEMRRQVKWSPEFKTEPETQYVPKPASQEGLTEALRRIAIANGYYRGNNEQEEAA